jgi:hypothetical protein
VQPNGKALHKSYIVATVALGKELLLLQRQALLPSELNTTKATSINMSLTMHTGAMDLLQLKASLFKTPQTPPKLSQGSLAYKTPPPGLESMNKWLFQEDYFFSSD